MDIYIVNPGTSYGVYHEARDWRNLGSTFLVRPFNEKWTLKFTMFEIFHDDTENVK